MNHRYQGDPERRISLPLTTFTRGQAHCRRPRSPAASCRLLYDECQRSQRPGQLRAEAHHRDHPPAVHRRGAALDLRQRWRGEGTVCWGLHGAAQTCRQDKSSLQLEHSRLTTVGSNLITSNFSVIKSHFLKQNSAFWFIIIVGFRDFFDDLKSFIGLNLIPASSLTAC